MYRQPGIYPLQQIISPNPPVQEAPVPVYPKISPSAVIGPNSYVIGDVTVADDVFIGFQNVVRADATGRYYIGPRTNLQDFVLVHNHPGEYLEVRGEKYGVYIEGDVSILHHAAAHGPLFIGRNSFIGQHASIYGAVIGRNCVIMHGAVITQHVKIADDRYVEPGQSVFTQEQADKLPPVPERFKALNRQIVDYYYRLSKSYRANTNLMI